MHALICDVVSYTVLQAAILVK